MLEIIVSGGLSWYYYNNIENNSYIKNVMIYAVANYIRMIMEQIFAGQKFSIIGYAISSFIVALIDIKVMEFAKKNTKSVWTFILLSIVLMMLIGFVIAFIYTLIIAMIFANTIIQ